MKKLSILITLLLLNAACLAQENDSLSKSTARKIQGKWQQTEQSNIRGEKQPGSDLLMLKKDFTYTWIKSAEKKKQSGKWKTDNYSKMSNTGKMMELLVLKPKSGAEKISVFIQSLTDTSLVLRTYDYSQGAPAKDSFTDLHFKRLK